MREAGQGSITGLAVAESLTDQITDLQESNKSELSRFRSSSPRVLQQIEGRSLHPLSSVVDQEGFPRRQTSE